MAAPIVEFRIYPPHVRKAWWRVIVTPNLRQLRELARDLGPPGTVRSAYGCCIRYACEYEVDGWGQVKCPKLRDELGVILLNRQHLDEYVVAHECCHATLYTAMRYCAVLSFDAQNWRRTDEDLAWMLGEYVRQIFAGLRKHKLVD